MKQSCKLPLATLREVCASICTKPVEIPWDAIISGRQSELRLYIYDSDLKEILAGIRELNIYIVRLWMM